jgi:choline dehydrogenase-like flavoprotein
MGEVLELPDYVAGNGVSVPDVIVIGSGPTGYLTAWRLSSQGRHVVVLEAGDARPDLIKSPYFDPYALKLDRCEVMTRGV